MTLKEIVEAFDGKKTGTSKLILLVPILDSEIVKLNNLNKIQTYVINHIE